MKIEELLSISDGELSTMNELMHELSPTSFCNVEKLGTALADDNCIVLVARIDNRIVGTATLCIMHTPEFALGVVEAVVVMTKHRGKGIGKQLMHRLIEIARIHKLEHLHLTSNPKRIGANALYQSIGFVPYHTNYYTLNLSNFG